MENLIKHKIITQELHSKIELDIFSHNYNKSDEPNIQLTIVGLSGNEFSFMVSEKDLYLPLYTFIDKIIKRDIEIGIENGDFEYYETRPNPINLPPCGELNNNQYLTGGNFIDEEGNHISTYDDENTRDYFETTRMEEIIENLNFKEFYDKSLQNSQSNKNMLYNNYYNCYQLCVKNQTLGKNHILMMMDDGFNPVEDKLVFEYNDYGKCKNFDKKILCAYCPVFYSNILLNPYICEHCENAFTNVKEISHLTKCPLCRDEYFLCYQHLDKEKTTTELYFIAFLKRKMRKSKLIFLLLKLISVNASRMKHITHFFTLTLFNLEEKTKTQLLELIGENIEILNNQ
jgi:hypothetical protein